MEARISDCGPVGEILPGNSGVQRVGIRGYESALVKYIMV